MLGVVVNHLVMQGGVLNASADSNKTAIIWLVEVVAYLSVDCYILISGHVNYSETYKGYKFNRIIDLWLQVVFWGILIYIIAYFCGYTFYFSDYIKVLFPISFNQYWFFTAYFALWFVMPLLNLLCVKLDLKQTKISLLVILVVFSGYATLIRPVGDIFALSGGFSFLWFCILYSVGALIKKYNLFICENLKLLKRVLLSLGITWFSVCFLGKITRVIVGKEIGESFLIAYNSPTILFASIYVMIFFLKIKIKRGKKLIGYWASATFGVYVIHMHPVVKKFLLLNNFIFIKDAFIFFIPFELIGCGMVITAFCLLLDKGREYLFKLIKMDVVEEKLNNTLNLSIARFLKL